MTITNYHKEISNHLEFLGYELEDLKAEERYRSLINSLKIKNMNERL